MQIEHSTKQDIDTALNLYRAAADYQRIRGYNVWLEFDPALIEKEIIEKRHYKITEGDRLNGEASQIACVFSIVYNDPIIWEERDTDPAVYLHRIATNPAFKGKGIMHLIKKWAADHAKQHNKKFIRMDTWGDNENLKAYYVNCGFTPVGQRILPQPNPLPQHYWGLTLSLFEIQL